MSCNKLGNKARNVFNPGALHTPSLRLDFFAPLFVSRQKVEEGNKIKSPMVRRESYKSLEPQCPKAGALWIVNFIGENTKGRNISVGGTPTDRE